MKSHAPHIHTRDDGRGIRDVYVNKKKIPAVFYADTKRGIVLAYRLPFCVNKKRTRILFNKIRGNVEVK